MSPTRTASDCVRYRAVTASGAKIVAISAEAAEAFLARVSEASPGIEVALGALQDDGVLIGVAILGTAANRVQAPATVAVSPARRRLMVGSDLLHALLAEATARGVQRLHVTYPVGKPGAEGLIRSSGLVTARRIAHGVVAAIVLVPAA